MPTASQRVLKAAALIAFSRALSQRELDVARQKGSAKVHVTVCATDVLAARKLLNISATTS